MDPLTSVLLIVTEIRGDVKSALTRLDKHETRIEELGRTVDQHGNRLSTLEALDQRDTQHEGRTLSAKTVGWTAGGVMTALAGIITAWKTGGG